MHCFKWRKSRGTAAVRKQPRSFTIGTHHQLCASTSQGISASTVHNVTWCFGICYVLLLFSLVSSEFILITSLSLLMISSVICFLCSPCVFVLCAPLCVWSSCLSFPTFSSHVPLLVTIPGPPCLSCLHLGPHIKRIQTICLRISWHKSSTVVLTKR